MDSAEGSSCFEGDVRMYFLLNVKHILAF
jgi:hypothetical protein